jgi:hypothetical protein
LLTVALTIEASSLHDEDARLVRSLTALRLAKARGRRSHPCVTDAASRFVM